VIVLRVQRPAAPLMLWTSCRTSHNFAFLSFSCRTASFVIQLFNWPPKDSSVFFTYKTWLIVSKLNSHNYAASLT
jgi:hypothetical protein